MYCYFCDVSVNSFVCSTIEVLNIKLFMNWREGIYKKKNLMLSVSEMCYQHPESFTNNRIHSICIYF